MRVLIAPHPDDEVIGAWSMLRDVDVVIFLTTENKTLRYDKKLNVLRSASKFGFKPIILPCRDVETSRCLTLVKKVASLLREVSLIYTTFPENHPDHLTAYRFGLALSKITGAGLVLYRTRFCHRGGSRYPLGVRYLRKLLDYLTLYPKEFLEMLRLLPKSYIPPYEVFCRVR